MNERQEEGKAIFSLGQVVATANAAKSIPNDEIMAALDRHITGNWGDVVEKDRESNESALLNGDRLFSVYHTKDGIKFWIITEADRSSTTVLLPEDY